MILTLVILCGLYVSVYQDVVIEEDVQRYINGRHDLHHRQD